MVGLLLQTACTTSSRKSGPLVAAHNNGKTPTLVLDRIAEEVLSESQSGFRKERSTVDMVFVARQLQEKAIEQDLYMVFVDLAKAFDTVNRTLLWEILRKDVIAPIIFNLFVAAVMTIAKQNISPADGVHISYRLYGNLFNLRRLQSKTLVTAEAIHELQYADDTAFVISSPSGLQRTINAVAEAYFQSGLAINVQKTEVLNMCQSPAPEFLINNQPLKNVEEFIYLGFVLSSTNYLTSEVQRRIGLVSASFGRLSYRVFMNRGIIITTKISVYKARQLTWLGRTIRMPADRLPRKILYSELAEGTRRAGRPRKRYKDHMKTTLKKCAITPIHLEDLAQHLPPRK
ncbi:uncharacterized protein LOC143018350 [Oratosquilla oratoria]|uniref:uncharacterized protein LOC143018350 n=1 Tax=Oratosquilla oratoria TaxID=337810 RepID=UPI003F76DCC8